MASGEFESFDVFTDHLSNGVHTLGLDTLKIALVTSTTTPVATMTDPRWGAGGSHDWTTWEVTPGGNYVTGGVDTTNTSSRAANVTTTSAGANPTWAQHASNPTNARWAIFYNDSAANKECIGWIDLGSDQNLASANFTINLDTLKLVVVTAL